MRDLTNRINNAVPGMDVSGLIISAESYSNQISADTQRQSDLQNEYNQLDNVLLRLQFYESRLGLTDTTSSVSIRKRMLDMQAEFFSEDPDEKKLLDTATSIFADLRNAASHNNDDNLSYMELLVQMNRLIADLKDYINTKNVESSLETLTRKLYENSESNDWNSISSGNLDQVNSAMEIDVLSEDSGQSEEDISETTATEEESEGESQESQTETSMAETESEDVTQENSDPGGQDESETKIDESKEDDEESNENK